MRALPPCGHGLRGVRAPMARRWALAAALRSGPRVWASKRRGQGSPVWANMDERSTPAAAHEPPVPLAPCAPEATCAHSTAHGMHIAILRSGA